MYLIQTIKETELKYIEADILKYQGMNPRHVTFQDWETTYRVRIYGTHDFLNSIKGRTDMWGVVSASYQMSGQNHTSYNLNELEPYEHPSNVVQLPAVVEKKEQASGEFECELCGKSTPVKEKKTFEGCDICNSCLIYSAYAGQGYC